MCSFIIVIHTILFSGFQIHKSLHGFIDNSILQTSFGQDISKYILNFIIIPLPIIQEERNNKILIEYFGIKKKKVYKQVVHQRLNCLREY